MAGCSSVGHLVGSTWRVKRAGRAPCHGTNKIVQKHTLSTLYPQPDRDSLIRDQLSTLYTTPKSSIQSNEPISSCHERKGQALWEHIQHFRDNDQGAAPLLDGWISDDVWAATKNGYIQSRVGGDFVAYSGAQFNSLLARNPTMNNSWNDIASTSPAKFCRVKLGQHYFYYAPSYRAAKKYRIVLMTSYTESVEIEWGHNR